MMTNTRFLTSLSVIMCASLLASCGPQKRSVDEKTAASPGAKAGTPSKPVATEGVGTNAGGAAVTENANKDFKKVEKDQSTLKSKTNIDLSSLENIKSVANTSKAVGSEQSLEISLIDKKGENVSINIKNQKSEGSIADKSVTSNMSTVSYKCDTDKSVLDCDLLTITIGSLDASGRMTPVTIERKIQRNRNVLIMANGVSSKFGTALVETNLVSKGSDKISFTSTSIYSASLADEAARKTAPVVSIAKTSIKNSSSTLNASLEGEVRGLPLVDAQSKPVFYKHLDSATPVETLSTLDFIFSMLDKAPALNEVVVISKFKQVLLRIQTDVASDVPASPVVPAPLAQVAAPAAALGASATLLAVPTTGSPAANLEAKDLTLGGDVVVITGKKNGPPSRLEREDDMNEEARVDQENKSSTSGKAW